MKSKYLFILLCSVILFSNYEGDAVIYLVYAKNAFNGYWFQFNPGQFSSGATSPLWMVMLVPCFLFSQPQIIAKILSIILLCYGIWVGQRALPKNEVSEIGLMLLLYFAIIPSLMIYETSILIIVLFYLIQGRKWAAGVLPFIRPEGIIISILSMRKWKHLLYLLPIVAYWITMFALTGYPSSSAQFRSQHMALYLIKRYLIILIPFIIYAVSKIYYWSVDDSEMSELLG